MLPGFALRGCNVNNGTNGGSSSVNANNAPSNSNFNYGGGILTPIVTGIIPVMFVQSAGSYCGNVGRTGIKYIYIGITIDWRADFTGVVFDN